MTAGVARTKPSQASLANALRESAEPKDPLAATLSKKCSHIISLRKQSTHIKTQGRNPARPAEGAVLSCARHYFGMWQRDVFPHGLREAPTSSVTWFSVQGPPGFDILFQRVLKDNRRSYVFNDATVSPLGDKHPSDGNLWGDNCVGEKNEPKKIEANPT
jgi:hypothetical protein